MLIDGLNLNEGSVISNLTVASGTAFPSNPAAGELFFRTDLNSLHVYNNSTWVKTYDSSVTYLTGNETITLSGDATGSGTTTITATLANTGVTAGTYKSVTVDTKGRVTAGTNPTTLAGYGITDAAAIGGSTSQNFSINTATVAGSLLPTVTSTQDIGSPSLRWKRIYVDEAMLSVNTLYLGDTPVMGTNANTVEIKTDPDQSMLIKTQGTGTTQIQSASNVHVYTSAAAADILIQTSGTGAMARLQSATEVRATAPVISLVGDTTVTGAFTVSNGLTVNGALESINSTNLNIKDNVILINSGETGNGVTAQFAGLQFDRGGLADWQLVFDESDDKIKFGAIGSLTTLATVTDLASYAPVSHVSDATVHLTSAQNTWIDAITATSGDVNLLAGAAAGGLTAAEVMYVNGVTSAIQTQLDDKLSKSAGGTMSNNIVVATGYHITLTDAPVNGTDAVNKTYVDSNLAGLSWKNSVKAATTANITLSGTQTIDGVALVAGNRVLVKDQTTASQNGIYVVAAGAWTRATDMDNTTPVNELNSAAVFVEGGTANTDTGWTQINNVTTLGTDAVAFTQFNGAAGITAGTGLLKTGNTLDINMGAGIAQLPSDEVGVDVYSGGGLMLTVDGTATSTLTNAQLSLTKTGVTASTYDSVTVDVYGRITAGTNPSKYVGTTTVQAASANQALTGILSVALPGATSGTVTVTPAAVAGTTAITIPATSGTLVTTGDTGTVTNTMLAGSIANAKLTNSSVTVGTTAIALGASSTTLAGLTSVTSTTFVGALTGNADSATTAAACSGNSATATTATNANNVAIADAANSTSPHYITFVSSTTGNNALKTDAGIWYNPNTNVLTATATAAQYADLAEKYVADAAIEAGTVVDFGGEFEVTVSTVDGSRKVAGVVSTAPAYLMNESCAGEHVVPVAFQGRVPVKVTGKIAKGDMLVSAGNGMARAEADPKVGQVIGKALQNFDGEAGVIEVVVGRD